MRSLSEIRCNEFNVAMPATLHRELADHLLKKANVEDVAFALYKPSQGANRFTGLIYKILLPEPSDRVQEGFSVKIMPEFFKRVCQQAAKEQSGVVLLHSHP